MVLKLSLKVSILLNTKIYPREGLGTLSSAKINPAKKLICKIGILENSFARKLISFRQSNEFLQSFLIQSLSLTKTSRLY